LLIPINSYASDIWVNNSWKNSFFKGLWEGCIVKTINASGYVSKDGPLTGIKIRDSKDPDLVKIKDACNCQTLYFQEHYSSEELKEILTLSHSNTEYKKLIERVNKHCL